MIFWFIYLTSVWATLRTQSLGFQRHIFYFLFWFCTYIIMSMHLFFMHGVCFFYSFIICCFYVYKLFLSSHKTFRKSALCLRHYKLLCGSLKAGNAWKNVFFSNVSSSKPTMTAFFYSFFIYFCVCSGQDLL